MKYTGLLISLVFHALLLFFAVSSVNLSPVKISLDTPIYKVDLVSLAPAPAPVASVKKVPKAAVAPVAVPKAVPKAVPPKVAPEVKKISPKKIKTTRPKKKKVDPKIEAERLRKQKALAAKKAKAEAARKKAERIKREKELKAKKEREAKNALANDLASLNNIVKNNEKARQRAVVNDIKSLSKVAKTSEVGGSGTGASGLMQIYGSIVKQEIRKNWRYPLLGQTENLFASVEISLKANGEISGQRLLTSSGSPDFDDSVLTAIKDTEVLPEPPSKKIRSIVLNFNLQDLN